MNMTYSWARARLIAYNNNGDHFIKKVDGTVIIISKELMKEQERLHINLELTMPGYDPIWSYNWAKLGEELDRRGWFESLTEEQKQELRRQVVAKV